MPFCPFFPQCSQTCLGGIRSRPLTCKIRSMNGEITIVDWVHCPTEEPSSIETCNSGPCQEVYEWKPQDWSEVNNNKRHQNSISLQYCIYSLYWRHCKIHITHIILNIIHVQHKTHINSCNRFAGKLPLYHNKSEIT